MAEEKSGKEKYATPAHSRAVLGISGLVPKVPTDASAVCLKDRMKALEFVGRSFTRDVVGKGEIHFVMVAGEDGMAHRVHHVIDTDNYKAYVYVPTALVGGKVNDLEIGIVPSLAAIAVAFTGLDFAQLLEKMGRSGLL